MQVVDRNGRLKVEITNAVDELTVGVTNIVGGVSGRALYDNAGVLGELDLASIYVPTTRTISTTAPLTGGGDLSANRTFSIAQATTLVDGYLSAADWTTFNNKVPTTRTLTINGTTQDLSADRTFTISTGITIGTTAITSGTVGRVLFEGMGNVVQESANLFWDNTNGRLGIGGTPSNTLDVQVTSGFPKTLISFRRPTVGDWGLSLGNEAISNLYIGAVDVPATITSRYFWRASYNTAGVAANTFRPVDAALNTVPVVEIQGVTSPLANYLSITSSGSTMGNLFSVKSTGNVLINTTTDAGFKLDVNGTARVATTSGSTPLIVGMSGPVGISIEANANGYRLRLASSTTVASINTPDSYLSINSGGQLVVIGSTSTYNSAQLAVDSTTKGFLPPRMTTTQINAIASPANGLQVYNTTISHMCVYQAGTWVRISHSPM